MFILQFREVYHWEYFKIRQSLSWAFVDILRYPLKCCGLQFKREDFLELDFDPILSRVKANTLELFGCKSISLHLSKALVLIGIWIPCCMQGMIKWAESWSSESMFVLVPLQNRLTQSNFIFKLGLHFFVTDQNNFLTLTKGKCLQH